MNTIITITGALLSMGGAANDADAIIGIWKTEEDKSLVEIYKVGDAYHGKIIDLKEKVFEAGHEREGQTQVDLENPDPKLRERPIIGLEIVTDFEYAGRGKYEDGKIYDPESGSTYKCKATLTDADTLKVRGYIGVALLGRTTVWKRVDPDTKL